MATWHTAQVYITNATDEHVIIELAHRYSDEDVQFKSWKAGPRETVGPLTVDFETGFLTGLDWWWVKLSIKKGDKKGVYRSVGFDDDQWKECMLEGEDANKDLTFEVDTERFFINLDSGPCDADMKYEAPYAPISNVFVLMLENHSFDHILGFSQITGTSAQTGQPTAINGLNGNESNTYNGKTYHTQSPAVDPMPSDPGHEFLDTLEQLCGEGTTNPFPAGPYPPVNNSGFVANYATTTSEGPKPPGSDIGDVMHGCESRQANIFTNLSKIFTVCDNWFSAIPGPTWPNRFFAMAGSSSGPDASPSKEDIIKWLTFDGVAFKNGSIFQKLKEKGLNYRIYNDRNDSFGNPREGWLGGEVPIAAALKGISLFEDDVHSLDNLQEDLEGEYPYAFTFIEPNYGDILNNTYKGGSSQHPMDTLKAGEQLIGDVFRILSGSPQWESSLLIVTYDEHGGFYDHVPPGAALPPGDHPDYGLNEYGFDFSSYGVRVPAVLVSPLFPKNSIDSTLYDHTSILRTLEHLFDLEPLTRRDAAANDFMHLLEPGPGQDFPIELNIPKRDKANTPPKKDSYKDQDDHNTPLPERGNALGFLHVVLKAELEMSGNTEEARTRIIENFKNMETIGDARAYFVDVLPKIREEIDRRSKR